MKKYKYNRNIIMIKNALISNSKRAFTLAEVLITLAVIGVVAALGIPNLIASIDSAQYQTAYKAAYADGQMAFMSANAENAIVPMPSSYDLSSSITNWEAFKSKFVVTKTCEYTNPDNGISNTQCWDPSGEKASAVKPDTAEYAFIDNKGRAWAMENVGTAIILCDTNGFKKPNQYGKDRFWFTFSDSSGNLSGTFTKLGPYFLQDFIAPHASWCPSGNCYYKSWLINANL